MSVTLTLVSVYASDYVYVSMHYRRGTGKMELCVSLQYFLTHKTVWVREYGMLMSMCMAVL